ncbi:MAG: AAA family ATPase [Caldilineaceae bacterium]|nr:AAA family ATPase [Caldilineaceae bacterium]
MTTNLQSNPNLKAQEAIRHLLDGNPPNGTKPEECGKRADLVSALYAGYDKGGTDTVRALLMEEAGRDEDLLSFLAGDLLDLSPQPADGENESSEAFYVLPSGAKVITWAEMKKMYGAITWAWPGWLPNGFLTMIVGQADAGKSLLTLVGVCKPYLCGSAWPDGTPFTGRTGKVLWIEGEGGQKLNTMRTDEFNVPDQQILSVEVGDEMDLLIDNSTHWTAIVEAAQIEGVELIVFDGLSGLQRQEENSSAMLPVVKKLAVLARTKGIPVIVTHHLSKLIIPEGQTPSLRHVRGHSSIVQTPRVVWSIDMPNRFDKETKRLAVIKCNLGVPSEPLIYHVADGEIELTSLPQSTRQPTQQDRAAELLRKELASGPVPSTRMEAILKEQGLLDAAKKIKAKMGIVSEYMDGVPHWNYQITECNR